MLQHDCTLHCNRTEQNRTDRNNREQNRTDKSRAEQNPHLTCGAYLHLQVTIFFFYLGSLLFISEPNVFLNVYCSQAFLSYKIYAKMLPLKQLLTRRCSLRERIISQGSTFSPATHSSQTLLTYFQLTFSSKPMCDHQWQKVTWIPHKEHDGATEEDIKFHLLCTVHDVHHHKPPILDHSHQDFGQNVAHGFNLYNLCMIWAELERSECSPLSVSWTMCCFSPLRQPPL